MRLHVRRTVAVTAAIAAVSLGAVACGDDASTTISDATASAGAALDEAGSKAAEATDAAKSAVSSATDAAGSAVNSASAEASGAMDGGGSTTVAGVGGEQITIAGAILTKYKEAEGGPLGKPKSAEESAPNGGKYQDFEGGTIYWSESTGAHIVWGDIRAKWEAEGGAEGDLGYPTSDEKDLPGGGKESDFSGGKITWEGGTATVTKN